MSWSVDYIYNLYKRLARKNQAGGISANDFFYYWNTEQNMYHQDIVGRWQARANGKQGANTGLIENETILSELAPFTIASDLTITSGNADKPSDFIFRVGFVGVPDGAGNVGRRVRRKIFRPDLDVVARVA